MLDAGTGVGVGVGVAGGAPNVNVPVTRAPPPPTHCVDILVPLITNVAIRGELPSAWVIVTVAVSPLAVPLKGRDWLTGTQAAHCMIWTPDTVDPLCVSVNVIGTWAPPTKPYVPDHVPVKGPADDGDVGELTVLPPPHEIATTINANELTRIDTNCPSAFQSSFFTTLSSAASLCHFGACRLG